jgi:predicted cupin superfamily sugar epimerase
MRTAAYWIKKLHLAPHPEGGYFVETYRSAHTFATAHLPATYDAPRAMATAIYFLLEGGDFSAFHRLKGDEIWHHYAGCPLTIHRISPDGTLTLSRLGSDPDPDQSPQALVPASSWFAATADDPSSYALVGCTTAPGFAYPDLELGTRENLIRSFPRHREVIERLTRADRRE